MALFGDAARQEDTARALQTVQEQNRQLQEALAGTREQLTALERQLAATRQDLSATRQDLETVSNRLVARQREHEERTAFLEHWRVNRRFYAAEQLTEYLLGAQVPGDYCEFGVWEGNTFAYAYKWLSGQLPDLRYWAFDSFAGLPELEGIDITDDGYSSNFAKAQYACGEERFRQNLRDRGVDLAHVQVVKGWFDQTLAPDADGPRPEQVSLAWIDCDLYQSTVPVLAFLTHRLSPGSVLLFDDWRCFRNLPEYGQQRAVGEWLAANPGLALAELLTFGWNGQVFTVTSVP